MKPYFKNLFIGLAVLLCIVCIGTCTLNSSSSDPSPPVITDSSFVKEFIAEKEKQIQAYNKKLSALQTQKDSLMNEVTFKKKQLLVYQYKSKSLESRLETFALKLDSSGVYKDSLAPLVDSLAKTETQSDSTCNQTVRYLEKTVANRDSSVFIYKNETETLRELQKQQAERERELTEALNTAYKQQRKTVFKNKALQVGMILLSGFSGALLVKQLIK